MMEHKAIILLSLILVVFGGCGDDGGCPPGQVLCGNECVNWLTNDDHCNGCNQACGPMEYCNNGQCWCVEGYSSCLDEEDNEICVNLNTDPTNCGSCGTVCGQGEFCIGGDCITGAGCEDFGLTDCGGECVDVRDDEAHCGDCGEACRADQLCQDRACVCPQGLKDCDGACVNTQNDPDHCSDCGVACGDDAVCINGGCQAGKTCADFDLEECSGACVDTQNDPGNCGGCGTACTGGRYCAEGLCKCPAGLIWCVDLDACVDTQNDRENCGGCVDPCGDLEACVEGVCTPGTVDHLTIGCDDLLLAKGASTQCHATAHYAPGQGILPQDVTADSVFWETDLPDDVLGIDASGLVTMSSDDDTGSEGVYAVYGIFESAPLEIEKITPSLCSVKLVPAGEDFAGFDPATGRLTLPYLAEADRQLLSRLHPVGFYRNDAACTQGGPYYYELTSEAENSFTTDDPAVASVGEYGGDPASYRVYLREASRSPYPAAGLSVLVTFTHNDGVTDRTGELFVDILPLTAANWTLSAEPPDASLESGASRGFSAIMTYAGAFTLDVTDLPQPDAACWPRAAFSEVPPGGAPALLYDLGLSGGEHLFQANNCDPTADPPDPDPCTGDTIIEISFQDAQETPLTRTLQIPVTVTAAP